MHPPQPRLRWCNATTHLDRFGIVTWAVDAEVLARSLPPRFTPSADDARAFVSVVPFVDRAFRFRAAPWPTLSCGQVNFRTYVVDDDGTAGVWFFGTSLDSRLVAIPRRLWRMPWHRERVAVTMDASSWSAAVDGSFGGLRVALRRTGEPLVVDRPATFVDPTVGWFRRTGADGGIGRYTVWHEPLALERGDVVSADVGLLTRLGLAGDATVAWAGVQPTTRFDVHTPPTRA